MRDAENNHPAVTLPKDTDIENVSRLQSKEVENALSKGAAPTAVPPAGGSAPPK
jgi:hypothetical protein